MDKSELNSIYGIKYHDTDSVAEDNTTAFLKGAILGYCQTHEPEEVAELFDDVFLILDSEKAANIAAAIAARHLFFSIF